MYVFCAARYVQEMKRDWLKKEMRKWGWEALRKENCKFWKNSYYKKDIYMLRRKK